MKCEFVESIHYRDFSRNFNVQNAPHELQPLRKGFNDINSTFKLITREKKRSFNTCKKYSNWLIQELSPMKLKVAKWYG